MRVEYTFDLVSRCLVDNKPDVYTCTVQDGLEDLTPPWGGCQAYFVGGTDGWKLTQASADLVAQAKGRGLYVHMGRVKSMVRLEAAYRMGCDSADGASYSWFSDTYLPGALRFLRRLERQPSLFEGTP